MHHVNLLEEELEQKMVFNPTSSLVYGVYVMWNYIQQMQYGTHWFALHATTNYVTYLDSFSIKHTPMYYNTKYI